MCVRTKHPAAVCCAGGKSLAWREAMEGGHGGLAGGGRRRRRRREEGAHGGRVSCSFYSFCPGGARS